MSSKQRDPDVVLARTPNSPDFLSVPKKGRGVRRLNRRPLLIVGALTVLAASGVSYTYYQRAKPAIARSEAMGRTGHINSSQPPVKPDADMVQPTNEPAEHAAPVKDPNKPSENVQPGQTSTPVDPDPTLQRRLMFIQQVEDRRLAKYAEALEADSKGQMNNDWHSSSGNLLEGQGGRHGHAVLGPLYPDPRIDDLAGNDPVRYGSVGESSNMVSENRQAEKRAFLADTPEADVYLRRQRTNAIAPSLEVKAGTVIPGVMISGINSDLPGTIIAQVRQDVYDSATGGNLLIPAGAKLIGTYDSSLTLGQQRALVVWQRIIYPDSSSLSLGNMPGTDMGGYAGFNDKVNNHYMRIFGSGLLLSAFSAGVQLSQPQARHGDNISSSQIIAGSLGQQLGQIGMQMAQRNMNIQPTIEIRPGYQFNVMVTKDIILPPWHGHPLAAHP